MSDISQINIPNNDGSMTYNIKDANVPHSSLPAESGGTDLSLVTTGEKAEWQDKGNYVIRGTNTTSNTFGHWTGNIPIPELYNGLIITYICSRNTIEVSSCDLELTFPDGSTSGRIEVVFDNGVNVSTEYQRESCLTLTYIDADHTSWGDPAWVVIAPSVLQWYVDNTEDGNYPLLFSEYAGRVTLNTTNCGAYKDTTFWYNPSTHNLHAEKVNGYTLAPACEKQVDTEVEQSSDNLPTSDAVYNAVNAIHIQTKTASGAIATFNDAAGDVPFATLKSEINPVQDLHGYSKPWSGGAGKNLLNYDAWKSRLVITRGTAVWENNGVTLTATANDCYTDYSTAFAEDARIPMSEGEIITLSWEESTNKNGDIFIFPNGVAGSHVSVDNARVKKISYTATSGVDFITFRFGVANSGDTIAYKNIQIEKGSQATSWEPYSNICPISGFSALNVMRTGVNLWDEQWELGGIGPDENNIANTDRIRSKNFIPVKPNLSVFIHLSDSRTVSFYVCEYDINKTFIQRTINNKNTVFTTSANCYFIRFFVYSAGNPITTYGNNISINYPSSDTEYHAYNGQTATVNFGQEVYCGVADVTNGKVTVNKIGVDLGSLTWSYITSGTVPRFQAPLPTTGKGSVDNAHEADLICSNYANTSWANVTNLLAYNGYIAEVNNGGFITVHDDNYTDAPTFKTAMSGVMIVYELATPIEIDTTAENLTAIVGQNNVYSDTNGDTTVEYFSGDCDGIIKLLKALSVI